MDYRMDIALRRLRSEDLKEVIEIEREAFAPLGVGTPFKRELNNKYSRYLVAYFSDREVPDIQPTKNDSLDLSLIHI